MLTDQVSAVIRQVADEVILPRFRALAPDEVFEKRPGDVVTVADRLAEQALTEIFRADDPACLVVGEEGVYADPRALGALPDADHAWVIDPVDGTRNFANGSPDFAVMVAEVRKGQTVRSWIWQPVHGQLFVAERGQGVSRNGQHLSPPVQTDRTVGALHRRRGRRAEPVADVELVPLAGCCGVDYPLLATGQRAFLGYWSMHPWDHLPGALMVTELGGRVATIDGRGYGPGVTGRYLIAASTTAHWDQAERLVAGYLAR